MPTQSDSDLASDTISKPPINAGKRSFVEHYGSTVLAQGLTLGLGVVTGVLSARMLGPAGRGEYAAIIIWPMAIASFLAFGINQAAVFHLGQRTLTVSETATAIGTIGLVQSALCIAIGLLVVPHVLAGYSPLVRHLGIVFVFFTPAVVFAMYPANLFQGLQDLVRFNLIRLLAPVAYATGLVGILIAHRTSLSAVISVQLAGYVLALALSSAFVLRKLRPHVRWNSRAIPRLFHFGIRTQGLSVAYFFNQRIDQLLLSLLVAPRELGLYAVAVSLSTIIAVFPQAAGIVAFSKGSGQCMEDARGTIGGAFRASLVWLLGGCLGLYALAPFLIHHVFGKDFDGSILACRILLPGALASGLSYVLYNAASALGRPGLASYAEGASVMITAAGLYLLVPRYGYVGAAIVSSAAYAISFLVMLVLANRLLGLNLRVLLVGVRAQA